MHDLKMTDQVAWHENDGPFWCHAIWSVISGPGILGRAFSCLAFSRLVQYSIKCLTSGYDTWFTAGGAIRIAHYDVIDDVITRKL